MKKRNPYLTAGLVMTGILTALIVMGVFWTPYDPNAMGDAGEKFLAPSWRVPPWPTSWAPTASAGTFSAGF